ncbi:MAG: hypothetical protein CMC96_02565 [Flavobacteriales bacterium]|nr:hypothetical protein [Flavobacteriales bacterium]|tara:strand:- start:27466 stop:27663 length:198 start_codon:yes stop_codon:yes gene_type:complete
MKKIHLKFSLLLSGIIILALVSTKLKLEAKQAVRQNTEKYLNTESKKENKEYRYYLKVFQTFNAQ